MDEPDGIIGWTSDQAASLPTPGTLPGHIVYEAEVLSHGFHPYELSFRPTDIALPGGRGCEWSTLGVVPEGPGLYLFTVTEGDMTTVTYAGQTKHLWMVTKGYLALRT